MTFIRPDNHIGLLGLLFACGAFAFWLERVPWAKRPSATLFIFGVPLVLSNRQVIPCQAPVRRSYQDCLSLLSRDGLWRLLPNKPLLLTPPSADLLTDVAPGSDENQEARPACRPRWLAVRTDLPLCRQGEGARGGAWQQKPLRCARSIPPSGVPPGGVPLPMLDLEPSAVQEVGAF